MEASIEELEQDPTQSSGETVTDTPSSEPAPGTGDSGEQTTEPVSASSASTPSADSPSTESPLPHPDQPEGESDHHPIRDAIEHLIHPHHDQPAGEVVAPPAPDPRHSDPGWVHDPLVTGSTGFASGGGDITPGSPKLAHHLDPIGGEGEGGGESGAPNLASSEVPDDTKASASQP